MGSKSAFRRARRDSVVGLLGVGRNGSGFSASIQAAGKRQHLGTFRTPEEAHVAYLAAKRRLHAVIRLVDVYQGGKVASGAVEFLYELLKERPPEANISHAVLPTLEQHRGFVVRRPYRVWMIVENEEGERVGSVYATERNEVGIFISRAFQRRGYALEALQALLKLPPLPPVPAMRTERYVAHVAAGNDPSKALFEKLGGKQKSVTYELP